jgi:hypothetical protein
MSGAILPLPNTPSWRHVQLKAVYSPLATMDIIYLQFSTFVCLASGCFWFIFIILMLTLLTCFVHSYVALQRNDGFFCHNKIQNTIAVLFSRT